MSRELKWEKLFFFFETALSHMYNMADGVNVKTNDLANQACFVCNIQRISGEMRICFRNRDNQSYKYAIKAAN